MAPESRTPLSVVKAVALRIGPDNLSLASAGVAFYALLAFFPGVSLLLSIYGLIADPEDVSRQLASFSVALPAEVLDIVRDQLTQVASGGGGSLTIGAILSFWFSLWSAARGTTALIEGLNIAFGVSEQRNIVKKFAVAIGLTFASIVGLSLVFGVVALLPAVLAATQLPIESLPMAWARWPMLLVGIALFAGLIYRWAPCRTNRRGRIFTPGAISAAVLQLAASGGFSWYVSHFANYNETYGSVGAVVIVMLWLYITAFVLLLGAEVDGELAGTREAAALHPGAPPDSDSEDDRDVPTAPRATNAPEAEPT